MLSVNNHAVTVIERVPLVPGLDLPIDVTLRVEHGYQGVAPAGARTPPNASTVKKIFLEAAEAALMAVPLLLTATHGYSVRGGRCVHRYCVFLAVLVVAWLIPSVAFAQQESPGQSAPVGGRSIAAVNQQANAQAQDAVEDFVERFRVGVEAGVGFDPELIVFGAHGAFAPIFHPRVEFRPGLDFGIGEVTTTFGINLDVLYRVRGSSGRWRPYFGAGPNFALSHQGFDAVDEEDDTNRFDFSDTDFETGFNFIAGARSERGVFVEMKATAYGVTNVRFIVGFDF